jgi:hypothetical protein
MELEESEGTSVAGCGGIGIGFGFRRGWIQEIHGKIGHKVIQD